MMIIITTIVILLFFIISAIPLHFSVILMGGKTNILKTSLIIILAGIVISIINTIFGNISSLVSFIILIWIYKISFKLGWISTVFAWLLQFIIILLLYLLIGNQININFL